MRIGDKGSKVDKKLKMKNAKPALVSAAIYTGLSTIISGLFLAFTLSGNYTWATRMGGASWVFLLSMIILMPTIIPFVKKRIVRK